MPGSKRDRDRATNAFRRWARAGCPAAEEIRTVKGAEDLMACAAVFVMLEKEKLRGRENNAAAEIAKAVREVYMEEPHRPLRKLEVTFRVRRVAAECWVSERQVYTWLARARSMWWAYRE